MYVRMGLSRCRLAALAGLFALYLAAALLLSSVALHEPHSLNGVNQNKVSSSNGGSMGLRLGGSTSSRVRRLRPKWCHQLKYIHPPRPPTALISFPGSGNTWLRYLLQQATGILTGSVYMDSGLLKNGFPAECITNGSVLVVKTHERGPLAKAPFKQAVLLVRSPDKAIQAEFNRQSGGHIGFASPDRYRRAQGRYWQNFVAAQLQDWSNTNIDWLINFTGPVHVIFYDDLVNNIEDTLRGVLKFLNFTIDENMLQCALERKEGIYRRKGRFLNFDPFTQNMRRVLAIEQERVFDIIKKYNSAKLASTIPTNSR